MNQKTLTPLFILFVLLSLNACTTTGNPAIADETRESLDEKLLEGVTTKQEVGEILGDPSDAVFIEDGKEVWTYEMSKITPRASNYVPYVNILRSGSDQVDQKLTILFDVNSVVEKYTWIESKKETRRGVLVNPLAGAEEPDYSL